MKVALISCSKRKQNTACTAAEMYAPSELFSLSYEYAKHVADRIFILSAKYGLLEEDTRIAPYNVTLSQLSEAQRMVWARNVIYQLKSKCDIEKDEFIILAGKDYYLNLLPELKQYVLPLEHLPFLQRITALNEQLNRLKAESKAVTERADDKNKVQDVCDELHRLFNGMRHYTYTEIQDVPFNNGIYVVFEKGEDYKGWERIVRIGTHTSPNRLRNRLADHFIQENKDGSIFRKNIGKAILNRECHPYLAVWTLDTSKPETQKYVDISVQQAIERRVSTYLRENMSFVVFPVEDQRQRLRLEEAIISTLNHAPEFKASSHWLGGSSPEIEIRSSGLWLKQGLDAAPLTDDELSIIESSSGKKEQRNPAPYAAGSALCGYSETRLLVIEPNAKFAGSQQGSAEIRQYILEVFKKAKISGEDTYTLVSGNIHREMGLQNKMPSVCNVMYQLMHPGDEILHTTPSGKSSTIKILYHLL